MHSFREYVFELEKLGVVKIRKAHYNDTEQIVKLHCSFVEEWYHDPLKKKGRCSYDELSSFERFLHGGNWMDVRCMKDHLDRYKEEGNFLLVAELVGPIHSKEPFVGKIIGQADVRYAHEPPPFGTYVDIEMLIAHKDLLGMGIEKAMVGSLIRMTKEQGYRSLDTCTISCGYGGDEVAFIKSLGFNTFQDQKMMARPLKNLSTNLAPPPKTFSSKDVDTKQYDEVRDLVLITHIEPSDMIWKNFLNRGVLDRQGLMPREHIFKRISLKTSEYDIVEAVVVVEINYWLWPKRADTYIWVEPKGYNSKVASELVRMAVAMGKNVGTEEIHTTLPCNWVPWFEGEKKGDYPVPWMRMNVAT